MPSIARAILLLFLLQSYPAQAQQVEGVDLNALPLPIAGSPFFAVRGAEEMEQHELAAAIRVSTLITPLILRAPSPAPEGYKTIAVGGSVIAELGVVLGLNHGFDVGLSMGAHAFQWGSGVGPLTGDPDGITPFGVRDPKLELGFMENLGSVAYRPFVALSVPLGSVGALSAEPAARVELGGAVEGHGPWYTWGAELGLLVRKKADLSATAWGSQLHAAGAILFHLSPEFSLGPEVHLLPVLVKQPSEDGLSGGLLFPAEGLCTLAFSAEKWTLKASGGTGIPLSRSAESTGSRWGRGPTSPNLRLGADLRLTL